MQYPSYPTQFGVTTISPTVTMPTFSSGAFGNPQVNTMPQQRNNGLNWVQGEVGAKAFPINPGETMFLMDSEDKYFYIKTADMNGVPSMKRYYYQEVVGDDIRGQSFEMRQMSNDIANMKQMIEELKSNIGGNSYAQPNISNVQQAQPSSSNEYNGQPQGAPIQPV